MAQPKDPPLSIRLSPSLLEMVEAWAKANDCKRNAAITRLLLLGLGNPLSGSHPGLAHRINTGVAAVKVVEERLRMPRAPIGSLQKKPPQPKKGK